MEEKRNVSAAGIWFWLLFTCGIICQVIEIVDKARGYMYSTNYQNLAYICYIISGFCILAWLIGKINKANDKIADLQKQIEEMKKQKDLNE